ncbi:MAG: patatin-like phospholipase family protein [Alphaproteobacteria bacterium]|nr:patatin-like phospholipase family protein [Alphaproteobacteria bacterium]
MEKIENLVFEGGGVRGVAYAGALQVLDERGMLGNIRRVAGASAGAFTSMLLSLEYTPLEVRDALKSIHFETLEDSPNPIRVVTKYGLYKGQVLYDWILAQVNKKGLQSNITFKDLEKQGARDLRVFATDLTTRNIREFSAGQTPDASVVGAVRASMSIPLMYSAWQFPDRIPDDHFYVDGGTVYNYPINAFDLDDEGGIKKTLGFCFFDKAEDETTKQNLDNLFAFTQSLFATVLSAQKIDFSRDIQEIRRSVQINDLGYKATDLNLSETGFDALFAEGRKAATSYLDTFVLSQFGH